jgi:hypothetical protein
MSAGLCPLTTRWFMTLSSRLRFYLPILSGITTTSPDADTLLTTLRLLALIVVEEYRASSYSLLLSLYLLTSGHLRRHSDWLRAGRSGNRIPVKARFSAPVQTGPGTHPASCTTGTVSFSGLESGRWVTLTPHPLLILRSENRVEL